VALIARRDGSDAPFGLLATLHGAEEAITRTWVMLLEPIIFQSMAQMTERNVW
jgi:hypothetical protein